MEGYSQLLDLIPKERDFHVRKDERSHEVSEDKKLELRLRPPGEEDQSLLSLGYFSNMSSNYNIGTKRGFLDTIEAGEERNCFLNSNENQCQKLPSSEKSAGMLFSSLWSCGPPSSPSSSAFQSQTQKQQQLPKASSLQCPLSFQSFTLMAEEFSESFGTEVAGLQYLDEKAYSTPAKSSVPANTAVPNNSHKRVALASDSVVGWPPIHSFRKNLGYGSSSKQALNSLNETSKNITRQKSECLENGLFVKINMDGIPIGRKVDLKAFESYEQLSCGVDELFRGLLAAQRDSSVSGHEDKMENTKATRGSVDVSGEYTLVYEDGEGDKMLVGDVPWHMFVSTAKRLRILKSSELSALCLCHNEQEKSPIDSAVEFGR